MKLHVLGTERPQGPHVHVDLHLDSTRLSEGGTSIRGWSLVRIIVLQQPNGNLSLPRLRAAPTFYLQMILP